MCRGTAVVSVVCIGAVVLSLCSREAGAGGGGGGNERCRRDDVGAVPVWLHTDGARRTHHRLSTPAVPRGTSQTLDGRRRRPALHHHADHPLLHAQPRVVTTRLRPVRGRAAAPPAVAA